MMWVLKRNISMRQSSEHPKHKFKHMFKLMGKKIITILHSKKNPYLDLLVYAIQATMQTMIGRLHGSRPIKDFNVGCSSGRTVEIPCRTCPTWSQFVQGRLGVCIYMSLDKYKFMFKVNTILYFIF